MKKVTALPTAVGIAAAATTVVAIAGAFYWWTSRQERLALVPAGANAIPQDAIATVSVSTNPQKWQQFRQYGTAESQDLLNGVFEGWRDRLFADSGIDYQQDIAPWVGEEVTFAFLAPPDLDAELDPEELDPENLPDIEDTQVAVAVVLPIDDARAAQSTLERPELTEGWSEREYRGLSVWENNAGDIDRALTVVGSQYAIAANSGETIERVVDAYRNGNTVLSLPGYSNAWKLFEEEDPFARVFFNLPEAIEITAETSTDPPSAEQLEQIDQQGLATIVNLESEGILLRSLSWLQPGSDRRFAVVNAAEGMAERLPADTTAMMSGGNLQRTWQDYATTAETNPAAPLDPTWLASALQQTVNLSLEEELLPWMRGKFALALVPASDPAAQFPGALVFVVKVTDGRQARDVLAKLDATVTDKYEFERAETTVDEVEVVNWVVPIDGLEIARGWLESDLLFAAVGAPVADRLLPEPDTALAQSDKFLAGIPTELDPNNGHFFLDVDRTFNAGGFPPLELPPQQEAVLAAIRSIGVTAAVVDGDRTRFDIFVRLRRTNR